MINAYPDAALCPATETLGHGDGLLRILLPARVRVGFRDQRVTGDVVAGDFTRGAVDQAVNGALRDVTIAEGERRHTADGQAVHAFANNNKQRYPQAEGAEDGKPTVGSGGQGVWVELGVEFRQRLPLNQQRPAHEPA